MRGGKQRHVVGDTVGGSSGLAVTDLSNGAGGSVGLAVTNFTNADAGGSMNLAVMGDYMASSLVTPAGQSSGAILSAAGSQPDDLTKPSA